MQSVGTRKDISMIKAFNGGYHGVPRYHTRKNEGCKLIGKIGTISVDLCDQCIRVHDGCTPGGCFKICATPALTPELICEAMASAPVIGTLDGINLPETLCDAMKTAPVLGTLEA